MKSFGMLLLFSALAVAQPQPSHPPLSQRVVHYQIDAKYDAKAKTLDAAEVLTYKNLTGQPLSSFPFHLYLNAFQPKATWIREAHRQAGQGGRAGLDEWDAKDYGAIGLSSCTWATVLSFGLPSSGETNCSFDVRSPCPATSNLLIAIEP